VLCRLLPHSLVDETTAVCLFVSDIDHNDRDFTITVDHYRTLLDNAAIRPQIDVFALLFHIYQYLQISNVACTEEIICACHRVSFKGVLWKLL